jgi:hypothetical protein
MIFNTDLVETLELDNLMGQAVATLVFGRQPSKNRVARMPAKISRIAMMSNG